MNEVVSLNCSLAFKHTVKTCKQMRCLSVAAFNFYVIMSIKGLTLYAGTKHKSTYYKCMHVSGSYIVLAIICYKNYQKHYVGFQIFLNIQIGVS